MSDAAGVLVLAVVALAVIALASKWAYEAGQRAGVSRYLATVDRHDAAVRREEREAVYGEVQAIVVATIEALRSEQAPPVVTKAESREFSSLDRFLRQPRILPKSSQGNLNG